MKYMLAAITANTAVNIISKTNTANNIINNAADKAERVADFLEELVGDLQEESDDFSMQ